MRSTAASRSLSSCSTTLASALPSRALLILEIAPSFAAIRSIAPSTLPSTASTALFSALSARERLIAVILSVCPLTVELRLERSLSN